MDLPRSTALVPQLVVLDRAASTNATLAEWAAREPQLPAYSTVVTDDQQSGRGRAGRSWSALPGTSLAISVLVIPAANAEWTPLVAGLAAVEATRQLGVASSLKWPNDVLVDGRKLCGILCEALPEGRGVVVGAGINCGMAADQLPVAEATSLRIAGAAAWDPDTVVAAYLTRLVAACTRLLQRDAAPLAREAVSAVMSTLGAVVRVYLPGDQVLEGTAVELDEGGRLVVQQRARRAVVAAGDVVHLRYK